MAPSLHKIIVGLDYGTTFSGVSYVTSNEDSIDKIEVINQWPGTSDTTSKVPTRMAYANENRNLETDKWGFTVSSSMESYSWTKLLLDRGTELTDFDDPALRNLMGSGMMRLPVDKSAKEVCEDFLTGLYHYTAETLAKKFSPEIYNITPVECWITVPAIWSDAAKNATRTAALEAGFGSRPSDTVKIITEPEAAALAALKPHLSQQSIDPVHPGETILLCDCGGGTVDITTYEIVQCQPVLKFKEVCIGMGGKLGSTYIDRNFNQFLIDTFGDAYTQIPLKKRGPGSAMMCSFETAKRTFGSGRGRNDEKYIEIEHLYMNAPSCTRYDEDEGTLKLSYRDMESLFDPVINEIIRLVTFQVDHAGTFGSTVDRIILVGGFGDSSYLIERMRSWCARQTAKHLKLTCPPQCQAAVVRGAALRGLENLQPSSRIARRHYGYNVGLPFRLGVDPESRSYIEPWHNSKYCGGRMVWGVSKGQTLDENSVARFEIFHTLDIDDTRPTFTSTTDLFCCNLGNAPQFEDSVGIENLSTVVTEFSRTDILKAPTKYTPVEGYVRMLEFTITIRFSTEEGVLVFATTINGHPAGRTKVEFHDN